MGRRGTIDAPTGARLVAAFRETRDIKAAAAVCDVPYGPAYRFLKTLPAAAAPVVATQQQVVEAAGASLWDTRRALEENHRRCLALLVQAQALDMSNPKAVSAHAGVLREIRAHIESGMKQLEFLLDVEDVRAFQQAVNDAIADADPDTAARIRATLRERRALGRPLGWPGAGRAGGDAGAV